MNENNTPAVLTVENTLASALTTIIAAHVGRGGNVNEINDIAGKTAEAFRTHVFNSAPTAVAPIEKQQPAVPVKKSVTPDYIICLEDGKKLKTLKRHIHTTYNMSPDEYRAKWNLPADYPMVAPNYAAHRSELAKKIGLGRKPAPAQADAGKGQGRRGQRKAKAA